MLKGWISNKITGGEIIGWLLETEDFAPRTAVITVHETAFETECSQARTRPVKYPLHKNAGFRLRLDPRFAASLPDSCQITLQDKSTNEVICRTELTRDALTATSQTGQNGNTVRTPNSVKGTLSPHFGDGIITGRATDTARPGVPRAVWLEIGDRGFECLSRPETGGFRLTLPAEHLRQLPRRFTVTLRDLKTGAVLDRREYKNPFLREPDSFDEYLRYSMTSPLVPAPFTEKHKRCFAFMESIRADLEARDPADLLCTVIIPFLPATQSSCSGPDPAELLQCALASALAQSHQRLEIIVAVNGQNPEQQILSGKVQVQPAVPGDSTALSDKTGDSPLQTAKPGDNQDQEAVVVDGQAQSAVPGDTPAQITGSADCPELSALPQDPRIRILHCCGVSSASSGTEDNISCRSPVTVLLNHALAESAGDMIFYLEPGAVWEPGHVATMAGALLSRPDAQAAYSGENIFRSDLEGCAGVRFAAFSPALLENRPLVSLSAFCHRKGASGTEDGFRHDLTPAAACHEFMLRISQRSRIASVPALTASVTEEFCLMTPPPLWRWEEMKEDRELIAEELRETRSSAEPLDPAALIRDGSCPEPEPFQWIYVIIPSFEAPASLLDCLDSLAASARGLIREIILCDSGSSEEALNQIREGISTRAAFHLLSATEDLPNHVETSATVEVSAPNLDPDPVPAPAPVAGTAAVASSRTRTCSCICTGTESATGSGFESGSESGSESESRPGIKDAPEDTLPGSPRIPIRLILCPGTPGFSITVNTGLSMVPPGFGVLISNNDAVFHQNAVWEMAACAMRSPKAGIIAPRQILDPGKKDISSHVPYAAVFQEADITLSRVYRNIEHVPLICTGDGIRLDYAPLFAAYITPAALKIVPRLDAQHGRHFRSDRIFSYAVRELAGLEIIYAPRALVWHRHQISTAALKARDQELYRLMVEKNAWSSREMAEHGYRLKPWQREMDDTGVRTALIRDSGYFDSAWYRKEYGDLLESCPAVLPEGNTEEHFHDEQRRDGDSAVQDGNSPDGCNEETVTAGNSSSQQAGSPSHCGSSPLRHYLLRGWRAGFEPSPAFRGAGYQVSRILSGSLEALEPGAGLSAGEALIHAPLARHLLRQDCPQGSSLNQDTPAAGSSAHDQVLPACQQSSCYRPWEDPLTTINLSGGGNTDAQSSGRGSDTGGRTLLRKIRDLILPGAPEKKSGASWFTDPSEDEEILLPDQKSPRIRRKDLELLERSRLFDPAWYLKTYPQIRKSFLIPAQHYLLTGWKQGLDPSPGFDTRLYLAFNRDVAAAGVCPLLHYLKTGAREGRRIYPAFQPGTPGIRGAWESLKRHGRGLLPGASADAIPAVSGYGKGSSGAAVTALTAATGKLPVAGLDPASPLVSVVVASYNYASVIGETLESILHQTFRDFEIVVVDDGSRDCSPEIIEKYLRWPFVRLVMHPGGTNRGLPETLKLGLAKSRGRYIAFCESDDLWTPDHLEQMAAVTATHPDAALIACGAAMFGDPRKASSSQIQDDRRCARMRHGATWITPEEFRIRNWILSFSCVMVRKDALASCDFDHVPSRANLDWWLWRQISLEHPVHYIPRRLTLWRMHRSYMAQDSHASRLMYEEFLAAGDKLLLQRMLDRGMITAGALEKIRRKLEKDAYKGGASSTAYGTADTVNGTDTPIRPWTPRETAAFLLSRTDPVYSIRDSQLCFQGKELPCQPRFSVIMATYNRAFCITAALDSLLSQNYRNFEIIVVDDGSEDGTGDLIRDRYAAELSEGRIVYIRTENHGVCSARNTGLKAARNPWILYLDSDNQASSSYLPAFAEAVARYGMPEIDRESDHDHDHDHGHDHKNEGNTSGSPCTAAPSDHKPAALCMTETVAQKKHRSETGKSTDRICISPGPGGDTSEDETGSNAGSVHLDGCSRKDAVRHTSTNGSVSRQGQLTYYGRIFCMESSRLVGRPFDLKALLTENYIDLNAWCHHISLFHQLGGFDGELRRLVDWDLIIRQALGAGSEPHFIDKEVVLYCDSRLPGRITTEIGVQDSMNLIRRRYCPAEAPGARALDLKEGIMPLVTTVITSYNHEEYIAEAIESALAQTGQFIHEIIIADDGSTDTTPEIIARYAASYPHVIRNISRKENAGISANLRRCFREARGRYVAILEGDDIWTDRHKLKEQMRFLEKNLDCAMVFSRIKLLQDGKLTPLPRQEGLPQKLDGTSFINEPTLNLIANFSSCIFRRDVLDRMPDLLFKERFNEIAVAFWIERQGKIGFLPKFMTSYRIHSRGTWSGANEISRLKSGLSCRKTAIEVCRRRYRKRLGEIIEHDFLEPLRRLGAEV